MLESLAREQRLQHVAHAVVAYLVRVLDDETMDAFRAMLEDDAPATKGLTMTYAEKLLAEGHQRGKLEGQLQGQLQGQREGERKRSVAALLVVLEARGLEVDADQRARIERCESLEELTQWLKAAAKAESAAAVFEA